MFRVANLKFNTNVRFQDRYASAFLPLDLTNKQLKSIQDAKKLETLSNDGEESVIGEYRLAGWVKLEKMWDGYSIMWQISSTEETDELNARIAELEIKLELQGAEFARAIEEAHRQLAQLLEITNSANTEPAEQPQEQNVSEPSEEPAGAPETTQEDTEA